MSVYEAGAYVCVRFYHRIREERGMLLMLMLLPATARLMILLSFLSPFCCSLCLKISLTPSSCSLSLSVSCSRHACTVCVCVCVCTYPMCFVSPCFSCLSLCLCSQQETTGGQRHTKGRMTVGGEGRKQKEKGGQICWRITMMMATRAREMAHQLLIPGDIILA